MKNKTRIIKALKCAVVFLAVLFLCIHIPSTVHATEILDSEIETTADSSDTLTIGISAGDGSDLASVLQIMLVLTVIALAPSILIMLTSFTRIVIVLHFTRSALGTQSAPPNQVLIGLSLFLTFFIMAPTFTTVYNDAIKPLSNNEISAEEAYEVGIEPIREFMFEQTDTKDLKMFLEIADIDTVETYDDIPTHVLIPSFIVSELRTAFIIGFLIYIPFIVIDMVVASALMSMGMMMLPPTTISLPFKILLFVMADGWNLIIGNLVKTFY
ncbi:MAG: flagellar type III secretion system pore protein FliP [Butyrivibrio sp.]